MAHRDRWASRTAFLLASFGSAIGLGNLWRFPMIAYDHGGGAFLVPYIVALLTAGIPLMMLEFAVGQWFQKSTPGSFRAIGRKWEFVGWWALGVGTVICAYYAVIMAWAWDYLVYSLTEPWKGDPQGFFDRFLGLTSGPGALGGLRWPAVVGLALTWASMYWIIKKGVMRVGKVVMFTVPIPVILTLILAIRGFTLPGAVEGLKYYLTPDFSALLDGKAWLAAYAQVFFSLSLGFGIMTAYASYRPKNADIANNAFMTSLADTGYAYLAGFAVFATLGYLATSQGVPVADVARGGPSLAFVVYPTAISLMPAAPLIGVLFFLTLLTLGIDSAFSIVEAAVAGLRDKWKVSQERTTAWFCLFGFASGLIFTTGAGLYWLDIVDQWMNNYGLVIVGLAECVMIGWFYGTKKLKAYINEVSDFRVGWWWDLFIKWVTPLVLGFSLVVTLVQEFKAPYGGYPTWALVVGGWLVVVLILVVAAIVTSLPERRREERA
jgi:NSS family neurotransmitter:Na+ symporter